MTKKFLTWLPRIIMIIYAAFISIFSFDVFGAYSGWELVVALFMHLIPIFIIIALLILAWYKPCLGSFAVLGLAVAFTVFFHTYEDLVGFLIISLPLFIVAILFYLPARKK
ncbi:hypothetical protein COT97_05365 [Candidatus Falkowbacteria bacterium CG10_big_fil_rev_8_21_14_0_10_39_11]|uniref:DUF7670 domain-containing protein n=1 Tax=Candidatus Falkowbacteria bacterium CG10_big_fil_rev_8_21_14_0_10_39_11 TaxID=1974565 RepID=A0A2H0V3N3_9BACT|nr:MAG: hypothetical protein COT97_05365 [Candidatus Falkowbacteria bacterium CG10_big_fil_rev_8_21_14_0_10_39_11]